MSKTYKSALADGKRVGVSKAEGEALLALYCEVIQRTHGGGLSSKMVYKGAQWDLPTSEAANWVGLTVLWLRF